jgi:acetoacetyl-CoA synthetase
MAPLWQPSASRIARSRLTRFIRDAEAAGAGPFGSYAALHRWSVADAPAFWRQLWTTCGVIGEPGDRRATNLDRMPGARFFPDARLSFAANLLRPDATGPAILAATEDGLEREWSFDDLRRDVARAAAAMQAAGVTAGDRVAGLLPNIPETVVAALAASSIGAVWSSCSPDFGVEGALDRFGQIGPVILIGVDAYCYGGVRHDVLPKLGRIAQALDAVQGVVVVPLQGTARSGWPPGAIGWDEWLARGEGASLPTRRLPFDHPLYILYSSGTTGAPKCIVHGAGGTLVQHLKEHQLQCDVQPGDRVFYFTTCGWMMWNWLVTALASRATIVLYDGSPVHPDARRLFDLAARWRISLFGVSARYLDAVRQTGLRPRETHDLSGIRIITSTGSPLSPDNFDFVYDAIAPETHLASISGGTDIVSCFVGGNPHGPVWRGEIQAAGLGMDVDVVDAQGRPVADRPGELVCRSPFPSMPLGFWNDPDGRRYRAAYFERFPGIWHHGDWIERTIHGGFIIHGRSDATLNPGGVRIGTAEIYRQLEALPDIVEALAVGQSWHGDERIVLFVRLADGAVLDDALRRRIAERLRVQASPRHVPARIVAVPDLPRTRSGKLVEVAVREVLHGRPVTNREALANPEALEYFRDRPELRA